MKETRLSIAFRKAAEKDLPEISRIQVEAFFSAEKAADFFMHQKEQPVTKFIQRAFNRSQQKEGHLLVAANDDNVIGYLILNIADFAKEDLVNIDSVAIDKEMRGQGIGRSLMEEAEKLIQEDGFSAALLQVDEHNKNAIDLYRSMGYTDLNYLKDYNGPGKNYLELKKSLPPAKSRGGLTRL